MPVNDCSDRPIVILGATSGMARSMIELLIRRRAKLILAARNMEKLKDLAAVLPRELLVGQFHVDASDHTTHSQLIADIRSLGLELAGVFVFIGSMHPQKEVNFDPVKALDTISSNFSGVVSLLNIFGVFFEQQGHGFISCVSSVAGDRGRRSNYLYGAAKAGLNTYLDGLRLRLLDRGVLVQTIKAGPTDTPMASKSEMAPFIVSPERVAREVWSGVARGKEVFYVPWFWRYIMFAVRMMPTAIFKRLPF